MIIINKEHYEKISKLIKDYSGIVLERIPQKRIEKKILEQMKKQNCSNINLYIALLSDYKHNSFVMDEFINDITISESYIFRNYKQFEYVYDKFFPDFFTKNNFLFPLRIWSAGCSHGEEAYSLAMIAKSFQQKNPLARFTINAGDINKTSLDIAQKGIYDSKSLKIKLDSIEEKLGFPIGNHDDKGNCSISDDLKEMVDFHWLNLKNISNLKKMKGSDIIFCRNVLIYFDEILRNKLIETFYECLNPNGLLFIGESECFSFPKDTFETLNNQGSYSYRKLEKK